MRDLRRDRDWEAWATGICCIASAIVGSDEANKAAKAQENAAAQSNALLEQQYNQTRADLSPYNQGGQTDFSKYNALTSGDPGAAQSTLSTLPGYQFTLNQGLKSTQNAAAARGLGVSGAALKGASTYATGLANSNYGSFANQLLSGAQLGEQAAGATAQSNSAIAGAQASNLTGAGNAAAAGDIATGKAISGGITGIESGLLGVFAPGGLLGARSPTSFYSAPGGYSDDLNSVAGYLGGGR